MRTSRTLPIRLGRRGVIAVGAAAVLVCAACSSASTATSAPSSTASTSAAAAAAPAPAPAPASGQSSAAGSASAGAAGGSSAAAAGKKLKIGIAVGGQPADWQPAQGQVAQALAKARGWDSVLLSNNNDGPTALKNATTFINDKVDAVLEFNGQPGTNPVMAAKLSAAKIPVITYDIAQPGWYFVGVDNAKAGDQAGQALGAMAKTKWNCQVDLVLSAEGAAAGPVNTARTGGARDGLKKICPDIPAANYVSYESGGAIATSTPAARDALSAHPNAKKILVVGINDFGVVGALQAAEQLGRADNIMGWGQDGSAISGSSVDPHLMGSVEYFLEGYPVYAFQQILDKISAGQTPAMADSGTKPAALVQPCPVTAEQAKSVPSLADRVTKVLASGGAQTEYEMFCPKSAG
ncbi:monosaccharide ABC transporter substrate-binding protein, CUT2 family [Nakamurella panacisegetis]|uniref:Monosaccharide ABC transporter substrate-binding protein, CUT2 family n=1 Tax=Nakamurella panacisegetis TaxID=1090615 RepID=A0A1H0LHA0_9ACTN|nr:sugar ABC transporter substrate-binding protein [Nakamurella panacisegetis]SDO67300.1 monosaccharide ABC transporter substrate-binding protein, CUT2 family [Nakamurella panacisegetis]